MHAFTSSLSGTIQIEKVNTVCGLVVMKPHQASGPRQEAHQTVRLQIDTKDAAPSIRISFTGQQLTAHGGLIVWSHFLRQKRFRQQLREVLAVLVWQSKESALGSGLNQINLKP